MQLPRRALRRPPPRLVRAAATPRADPLAAAAARAAALAPLDMHAGELAAAAVGRAAPAPPPPHAAALVAATTLADGALLSATDLACLEAGGAEYRQAVLVGPGLDTRASRLAWPRGVVIYDVAPGDAHAVAACARAKSAPSSSPCPSSAPPGCLHVRVAADAADERDDIASALAAAGHRGDRLSVAALSLSHLPRADARRTLASIASVCARYSLVAGDVSAAEASEAADLLAEAGVTARVAVAGGEETESGIFMFTGQVRTLSNVERDTLDAHAAAAEDAEGFFV